MPDNLDLHSFIEEASKVESSRFLTTLKQATTLLHNEHGQIGNLSVVNRFVEIKPFGEAIVVGDLHGDFESLMLILQTSHLLEKIQKSSDETLIFLGDYGDRGDKPAEIYYLILKLKLAFPSQIVLLRGNHEAPKRLLGEPHDLPYQLQKRFAQDWTEIYEELQKLWANLYNAVLIEDRYLMLHGGVSSQISSLKAIANAKEGYEEKVLEDLLWSDPTENEFSGYSPRGAGMLFSKSITSQVLTKLQAKILIRGHEASGKGYKINHDGKVLTLFSRKGSPYFNNLAAYLQVPLELEFEIANQLLPWIKQF